MQTRGRCYSHYHLDSSELVEVIESVESHHSCSMYGFSYGQFCLELFAEKFSKHFQIFAAIWIFSFLSTDKWTDSLVPLETNPSPSCFYRFSPGILFKSDPLIWFQCLLPRNLNWLGCWHWTTDLKLSFPFDLEEGSFQAHKISFPGTIALLLNFHWDNTFTSLLGLSNMLASLW